MYTWECLDQITNDVCKDSSDVAIEIADARSVELAERLFVPFSGYKFTLNASKGLNNASN